MSETDKAYQDGFMDGLHQGQKMTREELELIIAQLEEELRLYK